ncbi:FtsL-like putative cell division protein [uncultured Alistipes sp.]|uniref:FtsL-like putative cell division protein n=1 Tax=uncultured Alistipes sp. TaxID=538949 RepID=UPI0026F1ABA9|nr:FtsL-like putative cell division protein [uncultured Alistipes sp.]
MSEPENPFETTEHSETDPFPESPAAPFSSGEEEADGPAAPAAADGDDPPFEAEPLQGPSRLERYVGQILSGSILTRAEVRRQYPYVLFTAVLMFLYIANGFHIQKLHRRHEKLTAQVKELRARSLTVSSLRMISTRRSEILRRLEERGIPLDESVAPPKIIDK